MTALLNTLAVIIFFLIPIFLVIAIISLIRKKPSKIWFIAMGISTILWIILIMIPTCEHQWIEATCTSPKTCSLCEKTDGNILEHNWVEASCEAPKNCSLCGLTEGEALEHTPGEWTLDEESRDIVSATIYERQYCQACGKSINLNIKSFALHTEDTFIFSPSEFTERLGKIYGVMSNSDFKTQIVVPDEKTMGCAIYNTSGAIASTLFSNISGYMLEANKEDRDICVLITHFYTDDIADIVEAMIGILITCDPTLEVSDAKELGKEMILSTLQGEPCYHNGIGYVFGQRNGSYELVVSVYDK